MGEVQQNLEDFLKKKKRKKSVFRGRVFNENKNFYKKKKHGELQYKKEYRE